MLCHWYASHVALDHVAFEQWTKGLYAFFILHIPTCRLGLYSFLPTAHLASIGLNGEREQKEQRSFVHRPLRERRCQQDAWSRGQASLFAKSSKATR